MTERQGSALGLLSLLVVLTIPIASCNRPDAKRLTAATQVINVDANKYLTIDYAINDPLGADLPMIRVTEKIGGGGEHCVGTLVYNPPYHTFVYHAVAATTIALTGQLQRNNGTIDDMRYSDSNPPGSMNFRFWDAAPTPTPQQILGTTTAAIVTGPIPIPPITPCYNLR